MNNRILFIGTVTNCQVNIDIDIDDGDHYDDSLAPLVVPLKMPSTITNKFSKKYQLNRPLFLHLH